MRTTVTLDPDVEALLRSSMKQRGQSFKEALNSAIRTGLTSSRPRPARFRQKTFRMGAEPAFRWDKALAVAESLEDDEIARKLAVSK